MQKTEGTDSFENIRRSVKISHFVASIIPLALLVYFSIKYVYPYVTEGDMSKVPLDIGILLLLAVAVSVLGLMLTTKVTNTSINSARNLHQKLNSLFGITKQFRETLYLDILLENIIKSAIELTGAESGSILLYNNDHQLQYKFSTGKNSEKMLNKTINNDKGVAVWVTESGKAALINDLQSDKRYNPDYDRETGLKTKSILCVPLINSNETIGAIEMRHTEKNAFTSQDELLLYSLADQASISIVQKRSNERQQSDLIHITEMLVNAQDYIQNKKGHARRVASYANSIGKQLDFPEPELKKLYYASLLHDIGMLKIDTNGHRESDVIKQHPKLGHDLIKSISTWGDSADFILHHHEKYDGTGYPMAKREDEIPLGAQVIHVADSFDDLATSFSHNNQIDYNAAVVEIEAKAGKHFNPRVVQALKESFSEAGLFH